MSLTACLLVWNSQFRRHHQFPESYAGLHPHIRACGHVVLWRKVSWNTCQSSIYLSTMTHTIPHMFTTTIPVHMWVQRYVNDTPRNNFDTFGWSFLTVFQVPFLSMVPRFLWFVLFIRRSYDTCAIFFSGGEWRELERCLVQRNGDPTCFRRHIHGLAAESHESVRNSNEGIRSSEYLGPNAFVVVAFVCVCADRHVHILQLVLPKSLPRNSPRTIRCVVAHHPRWRLSVSHHVSTYRCRQSEGANRT